MPQPKFKFAKACDGDSFERVAAHGIVGCDVTVKTHDGHSLTGNVNDVNNEAIFILDYDRVEHSVPWSNVKSVTYL